MWILNFIPTSWLGMFSTVFIVLGIILFFGNLFLDIISRFFPVVKLIPNTSLTKTVMQVLGVLLIAIGVYFKGGEAVEAKWRNEVKRLEGEVKIANEKSKNVNAEIKYVYLDKVRKIKEVEYKTIEIIKEVESIINTCDVTPTEIEILNSSAKNVQVELTKDLTNETTN
jgi:hypothetical protein